MLMRKAALAGVYDLGRGRRGPGRTQDQHAASMVGRLRRRGDRQTRRDVHRRRRQVGADLDRRPHRQHARQAARRRRRRQRAARRAAQGPGNRRMERDRHDRQSRRARHGRRLGQGRRSRAAAGDEADRRLGRGADEHPPHQLALGLDRGDGEGGHQGSAEELGRVQRRLRQGGRRRHHLRSPFQRRLDRRDRVRSRRLRARHRPVPQGLRRGRHRRDALGRNGQGVRAVPPDDRPNIWIPASQAATTTPRPL